MTEDSAKLSGNGQVWTVDVAGRKVDLPIVPINPNFAISLMMVIDLGVRFGEHTGKALAEKLAPLKPDVIVGAATLGIPVAIEVSRALGLDDYVILQKSPKIHLGDALVQTISSITSKGEQRLLLIVRQSRFLKESALSWWMMSLLPDQASRARQSWCARLVAKSLELVSSSPKPRIGRKCLAMM